jgi:hypothetical protein
LTNLSLNFQKKSKEKYRTPNHFSIPERKSHFCKNSNSLTIGYCSHSKHNYLLNLFFQTLLQIVTLANFIFDGICTYLSLHTLTTYLFALSATGSLLCLCAVISAVQEEKQKLLGTTSIWASLKMLVVGILYITATASMIEFYYSDDSYTIEPELIILFFFIPICMLSLGLQWKLTVKVAEIIRARDEFYTIPSANCSTELRPSLRLYLAAQKLKGFQKF